MGEGSRTTKVGPLRSCSSFSRQLWQLSQTRLRAANAERSNLTAADNSRLGLGSLKQVQAPDTRLLQTPQVARSARIQALSADRIREYAAQDLGLDRRSFAAASCNALTASAVRPALRRRLSERQSEGTECQKTNKNYASRVMRADNIESPWQCWSVSIIRSPSVSVGNFRDVVDRRERNRLSADSKSAISLFRIGEGPCRGLRLTQGDAHCGSDPHRALLDDSRPKARLVVRRDTHKAWSKHSGAYFRLSPTASCTQERGGGNALPLETTLTSLGI
jgi:hypothetical protein